MLFISPDGIAIAGHGTNNPDFLSNPEKVNTKLSTDEETSEYRELFENLMVTTKNIFKNSEIFIVQQQDPKCFITDKAVFARTKQEGINDYCSALASIYYAQNRTLKKLNNPKIKLIKMHNDNPIPDEGFYDGLHTNSYGSLKIGEYLLNKINK